MICQRKCNSWSDVIYNKHIFKQFLGMKGALVIRHLAKKMNNYTSAFDIQNYSRIISLGAFQLQYSQLNNEKVINTYYYALDFIKFLKTNRPKSKRIFPRLLSLSQNTFVYVGENVLNYENVKSETLRFSIFRVKKNISCFVALFHFIIGTKALPNFCSTKKELTSKCTTFQSP